MDFKQVYANAGSECDFLNDKDLIKIYIGPAGYGPVGEDIVHSVQSAIGKSGIKARTIITGPSGYSAIEPLMRVKKPGHPAVLYRSITPQIASELINEYAVNDNPGQDNALCSTGNGKISGIPDVSEVPLFALQRRIALRNCGYIDPGDINHYIICGQGYSGLSRVLQMDRPAVIGTLAKSGLRGRGGAGYPTADKWKVCHDSVADEKYVVCNAMDADPASTTARLLLESDPHSVLEGMLIAAYAVSASHCIICLNAGYSTAVERLQQALEQMSAYSLTGNSILDSGFGTDIEIREVPASLVSGEETALLCFLEGKQAMPYVRPPYPAVAGPADKTVLVNNIETMSNISAFFQNEQEWLSVSGTGESKGTKVITLTGDILNKFTVEVPFGTTLKTLLDDIGGGVTDGKAVKAVQFGGPAGIYFSAGSLDIPVDYEALKAAGSMIGSGTLDVIGDDLCAIEMVKDRMAYLHTQSCGKCVFCREGTYQMSDIITDISEHKGKPEYIDLLIELGDAMKTGSICGLGRNAANPVMSSIELFRDEYEVHIKEKRCPVKGDR